MSHTEKTLGFIMLRHVNNEITDKCWQLCYDGIRKYYPENVILIIDDTSDYSFITNKQLYKTVIIHSEFSKRGELLPYYYYLQYNLFDIAVIIHDSVFIQQFINFSIIDTYKMLWEFEHDWDNVEYEVKILKVFNNKELDDFYNDKTQWKGCFGGMTIITHKFLTCINDKYNLRKLLDIIVNRNDRMCFERVIACILQKECRTESVFGDIHKYMQWGIVFAQYQNFKHLPMLKIWSGR